MAHWHMLTLVGNDRPGIVAKVTAALYDGGCNLGETSMMRLGGTFTIMMMVHFDGRAKALADMLEPVVDSLGLHLHVDPIETRKTGHQIPDVRITVFGADRAGIVAQVTGALAEAGLNILDLESDVGGSDDKPVYILHIEGQAGEGIDALRSALDIVKKQGMDAEIAPVETLIG